MDLWLWRWRFCSRMPSSISQSFFILLHQLSLHGLIQDQPLVLKGWLKQPQLLPVRLDVPIQMSGLDQQDRDRVDQPPSDTCTRNHDAEIVPARIWSLSLEATVSINPAQSPSSA